MKLLYDLLATYTAINDHPEVTEYLLDLTLTDIHNLGLTLGLYHHHLKSMSGSVMFRDDMIDAWLQERKQVLKRTNMENLSEGPDRS